MAREAWFGNNYEGKAMRYIFTRTMRRFKKKIDDENTTDEEIDRITNILTRLAKCKADLAKPENEYILRLAAIEQALGIGKKIEYRGELPVKRE